MRKALGCAVALASIFLLVAVTCAPARAVDYKMGLSVGNTATYSVDTTNNTVTSQVIEVVWTNTTALRLVTTTHYTNGTVDARTNTWDVRYGPEGNLTLAFTFEWLKVVATNLTVGDNLWMAGDAAPVNSSATLFAAGALRTVNVWNRADDVFAYWDRSTGLVINLFLDFGSLFGWVNLSLSSTNIWGGLAIPGYPFEAIGIAVAIGVLTGVLYHRKHPKRASPP